MSASPSAVSCLLRSGMGMCPARVLARPISCLAITMSKPYVSPAMQAQHKNVRLLKAPLILRESAVGTMISKTECQISSVGA